MNFHPLLEAIAEFHESSELQPDNSPASISIVNSEPEAIQRNLPDINVDRMEAPVVPNEQENLVDYFGDQV